MNETLFEQTCKKTLAELKAQMGEEWATTPNLLRLLDDMADAAVRLSTGQIGSDDMEWATHLVTIAVSAELIASGLKLKVN